MSVLVALLAADHGRVGFQIWSAESSVLSLHLVVSGHVSKGESNQCGSCERVVSEGLASDQTWLSVREVVHYSIKTNNGDTTSSSLELAANHSSNGPGKHAADCPVDGKGELSLTFQTTLVLPWDAFRVCSVLAETIGNPRVRLEVILEPVNVFNLLCLGGNGGGTHFKHFISFFGGLIESLVHHSIESGLAEHVMVSRVKLARHFCLSTCAQ